MKRDESYDLLPIYYILFICFSIGILEMIERINENNRHEASILRHETNETRSVLKFSRAQKIYDVSIDSVSRSEISADSLTKVKKLSIPESNSLFYENLLSVYRKEIQSDIKFPESRTDIVIRYYKKSKDKDRVYSIRKLGFYIHERPTDNAYSSFESNAISYGDSVKREDILLITLTLLRNGVKLQNVSLSKFHDNWKAHSIEIGTEMEALENLVITEKELRARWND